MEFLRLLLVFLPFYLLLRCAGSWRQPLAVVLNLSFLFLLFRSETNNNVTVFLTIASLLLYLHSQWKVVCYAKSDVRERIYWLNFCIPLVLLVIYKVQSIVVVIGFSYISFRILLLLSERNEGKYADLKYLEFFNYCLFFPTIFIGPISPLSTLREHYSLNTSEILDSLARVTYGVLKIFAMSQIILYPGWNHPTVDLYLKGVEAYLFVYFNFSGYCDVVIGLSRLFGYRLKENFDNPLLATNIQDFWSRWHMSLSHLVRDAMFVPLYLSVRRRISVKWRGVAIALILFICFVAIGIWHEVSWRSLWFAILQTGAILCFLVWRQILKPQLPTLRSRWTIGAAKTTSWAVTFAFVSWTMGILAE